MKRCTKCGTKKDESKFPIDRRSKDGLFYSCKDCWNDCSYELRQQCFALFGSKCQRCSETNIDVLTINHIEPPTSNIYKGLKRSGYPLYKQILNDPSLKKHFNLLCFNCNWLDYYRKSGYYNVHTNYYTLWHRKKKTKICEMWHNKCFRCFRTFPVELLTINHVNGRIGNETKWRGKMFVSVPTDELINRIDSGELELTCFNCNCNRAESSKWTTLGKAKRKL